MKTNTTRLIIIFFLLLVIPLTTLGVMVFNFVSATVSPPGEQLVQIRPGTPLKHIAEQLEQAGIVSDAWRFALLARWEGTAAQVQAGEYLFSRPASPEEVLQRLVAGDVRRIQVTFPEGLNLHETAQRVAAIGLCSVEGFLSMVTDPQQAARHGISAKTLEGYLFPETYTLQSDSTAADLLNAMLAQSNAHLTPELLAKAASHGLDRHQLVILASIIQKEAGNEAEMPLISAVFHNRLRRGIALQADPTVIYGIADFDGNLTRKHLETPTPYNTYRKSGLPAGPIANPGQAALQAAAHPADVNYLYFVAKGDGTHAFNTTLSQHNQAVRRYQLRR
jgi:UPF0755 protein